MFGAGGGTSSYREAEETDLIVLWGSNARETHPIFFHHLLKGVRNGARLYAVDPRRTSSAEWADVWLGLEQHYLPVKLRYPVAKNRLTVEQVATRVVAR